MSIKVTSCCKYPLLYKDEGDGLQSVWDFCGECLDTDWEVLEFTNDELINNKIEKYNKIQCFECDEFFYHSFMQKAVGEYVCDNCIHEEYFFVIIATLLQIYKICVCQKMMMMFCVLNVG